MRAASGFALVAIALASAGCGTGGLAGSKADASHGKQLFTQKCGSCHTLADAGTQGTIGPNLDDAFLGARQQGFKESTIRNVVRDQILFAISNPSGVVTVNGQEQPVQGMPQKIVTGQDAKDVAAYVASVAGVTASAGTTTSAAPPSPPQPPAGGTTTSAAPPAGGGAAAGKALFTAQGCGACHTFAPAGSSGRVGPNLDHLAADAAKANRGSVEKYATESISDPNAYVVPNFPKGVMPTTFASLGAQKIAELVAFLLSGSH